MSLFNCLTEGDEPTQNTDTDENLWVRKYVRHSKILSKSDHTPITTYYVNTGIFSEPLPRRKTRKVEKLCTEVFKNVK